MRIFGTGWPGLGTFVVMGIMEGLRMIAIEGGSSLMSLADKHLLSTCDLDLAADFFVIASFRSWGSGPCPLIWIFMGSL
jgi:hypothetical protein